MYDGFPVRMIGHVRCQRGCGIPLILTAESTGDALIDAAVRCPACLTVYFIEGGILDLTSGQDSLDDVSATEIAVRDRQAAEYVHRVPPEYDAMEIPSTLRHVGDLRGRRVLELGCGVGRFTTLLRGRCDGVLALDFSRGSLMVLAAKLEAGDDVGLVLADATQVRVEPGGFDLALSTQVLEHIPRAEGRFEFLARVREALAPGGRFVCTAYHHDLRRVLRRQSREGRHPSGIFFRRFSIPEMKTMLREACFAVERVRTLRIQLPYLPRYSRANVWLSRKLERIPLLRGLGKLVLVAARNT